jgi:hypothetical protein
MVVDPRKANQKAAPPKIIDAWVRSKPVKPQKGGGLGFAKVTEQALNSMAYLMNRKIKYFGIDGNQFFTKTLNIYTEDLEQELGSKIARDLANDIRQWPKQ